MTDQHTGQRELSLTASETIAKLMQLRAFRERIKAAFKEQDDRAKEGVETLQAHLLKTMNESGLENVKTDVATAYMHRSTYAKVTDWEAFYDYIVKTGKVELLSKRIASGNVLELAEEIGELPPGTSSDTTREVRIRKS